MFCRTIVLLSVSLAASSESFLTSSLEPQAVRYTEHVKVITEEYSSVMVADTANSIIRLSGFTGISEQVRQLAYAHLASATSSSSQRTKQDVLAVLMHWAPEPLSHKLEHRLAVFDDVQQRQILELLSDPIMVQARDAEVQGLMMQSSAEYSRYTQRLRQRPPGQSRRSVITILDQAMGMSQWMLLARATVARELSKHDVPFELSEDIVREKTQEYLFYAYRFTSNADIQRIAKIWQTPPLSTWSEVAYLSFTSIQPLTSGQSLTSNSVYSIKTLDH